MRLASIKWPPSTDSTLAAGGGPSAVSSVASANSGLESLAPTTSVGWVIVPSLGRALGVEKPASFLGQDRRAVGGEHLSHRLREPVPALLAQDAAEQGLTDVRHVGPLGGGEELLVEVGQPARKSRAKRQPTALKQRQRTDTVRVAQREVDGDLAAIAAPDHDRRRRAERVEQRRRIIGLQVHVRFQRLRSLAVAGSKPRRS